MTKRCYKSYETQVVILAEAKCREEWQVQCPMGCVHRHEGVGSWQEFSKYLIFYHMLGLGIVIVLGKRHEIILDVRGGS